MNNVKIGDKVFVTEGSSYGHTGVVIEIKNNKAIVILRDYDKLEVTVSNYEKIHKEENKC